MSRFLSFIVTSCFMLLLVTVQTFGQTATATLSGVVEDQQQAVIPGAAITVINPATGLRRTVETNESGQFTVPLLPPGTYAVTVRRDGFTQVEVSSVVLNVGDQKSLRIALKVGDVNAAIEVTAEAPLIDESPAVGTTVDRQFVANLPLNGRSFSQLIALTPGVVQTKAIPGSPGQFSINGQRPNSNYFTVDGVSANSGVSPDLSLNQTSGGAVPALSALGGTNNLVSIDALQEFKIQTSSYAPEFGRTPGGQIQIATRSGANDFHGTLFNYFRNEKLDANDWFSNRNGAKRSPMRQNDFGGTLSGPVYLPAFGDGGSPFYNGKNKTFFFFSYEGLRLRQPQFVSNAAVPSLCLRGQQSSCQAGQNPAVQQIRPFLNAYAIPNGAEIRDTSGQLNGLAYFSGGFSNPSNLDATSIRIDQNVGSRITLFGRYNYSPSDSTTRNQYILTSPFTTILDTQTLTFGSTQVVSSSTNNDLRFNYSRNKGETFFKLDNFGGGVPVPESSLLSPLAPADRSSGAFAITYGGFPSLQTGINAENNQPQINLVDSLIYTVGAHQLKFGVDYRRTSLLFGGNASSLGVLFFDVNAVRTATASFVSVSARKDARPIYTNFSAFAQDTWKASQRLTLTYGLRWEVNPPPSSADGRDALTATGLDNPATIVVAPEGTPLYKTTYNNFAPRFGAAYQVFQKGGRETVLRGGIGVFYDLGSGPASTGFILPPFATVTKTSTGVPFPELGTAAEPFPFGITFPLAYFNAFDPNLKLPRTYQWNLAVEQSLGANQTISVSYVGAIGRKLISGDFLSQPNQYFTRITIYRNKATSDYHAMQLQFQRRLTNGFQILSNYTWAKSIDLSSSEVGGLERGPSDFDVRHNFSAAITYELPYPKLNKFIDAILKNWAVDGIYRAQSATPIDLIASSSFNTAGQLVNQRPDLTLGIPLYLDDPNAPGGRKFNNTLDPSRPGCKGPFCLPPTSRQGTLGRNVLRGFPLYQTDISLRRQFGITERLKLQLRADVFNVFNTPNFADPTNTLSSGTFGLSTAMFNRGLNSGLGTGFNPMYQVGGPRSIQLSAKFQF